MHAQLKSTSSSLQIKICIYFQAALTSEIIFFFFNPTVPHFFFYAATFSTS